MKKKLFLDDFYRDNYKTKFVDFHGWEMPISFTKILSEHINTRENTSVFDISHMGIIFVQGKDSKNYIQKLIPNNLEKINLGKGLYTHFLDEDAEILDDLIVYWVYEDFFIVVVNASNTEKDLNWMLKQQKEFDDLKVELKNDEFCFFAIQGPKSVFLYELEPIIKTMKFFDILRIRDYYVCRTGYTGDMGFEIIVSKSQAKEFLEMILKNGVNKKINMAGLAARDSLRIEAGLPLYGNEFQPGIKLTDTNLMWTVDFNKDFIGKKALLESVKSENQLKFVGFVNQDKGIPRKGDKIFDYNKKEIGFVTSGTFSPTMNLFIGMGYIKKCFYDELTDKFITITTGKKSKRFKIVDLPFFKKNR
jgi:aminomethyltransferase